MLSVKVRDDSSRAKSATGLRRWFGGFDTKPTELSAAPRRGSRLRHETLEPREMLAGDAPFLPVLQLESGTGVFANAQNGMVTAWQDLSGNDNHIKSTGDERPTFGVVQTPTGADALRFDGIDDRLIRGLDDGPITGLPEGNASRTVFLVAQFHDATAYGGASYGRFGGRTAFGVGVAGPGADEGDFMLQTWGRNNDLISDESAYDAGGTNGWVVLSAVHVNDGSNPAHNEFLYVDGQEIASWNKSINTKLNVETLLNGKSRSRIVIGEEIRELGSIEMDVAAYLVYDGALDASERGQVEAYLTNTYLVSAGDPPVAGDDSLAIGNGAAVLINVLSNDSDPDGLIDPTTVAIVSGPSHAASVSVDPQTGAISYTHNGSGEADSFTYTVRDQQGLVSNTATVTISIDSEVGSPVAIDDRIRLDDGATVTLDVLGNDGDPDGAIAPSTLVVTSAPSHASSFVYDAATGTFSYTHDGSDQPDSFTYRVRDDSGLLSNEATVHLAVNSTALSLAGFSESNAYNATHGIITPVAITFLPDGRMLMLQKDGVLLIGDPYSRTKSVYGTLTNIDDGGERGLLEIAVSPDFDPDAPGEDYIYLYYTPASPQRARIARFTHQENSGGLTSTLDESSEFVLWEDTDGYLSCCHYGGGLDFGPDGKLWLSTSDKFTAPNPGEGGSDENLSQDLTKAGGKLIRVNVDGTVPDGTDGWPANPFIDPVDDDPTLPGNQDYLDTIWGYGLRNPFRASWDIESGRFFMGEVGGNLQTFSQEDVHVATLDQPGVNFGWPNYEGPGLLAYGDPAEHSTPIFSLPHAGAGASITGGEVYRGDAFPSEWDGAYFYGDYTRDTIRYLLFDDEGNVTGDFDFKPSSQIPGNANQVVSITVGPDGALYYSVINGRISRITHDDANKAPSIGAMTVAPRVGDSPLTTSFTTAVSDPDGDSLTYTWQFGDGQSATGAVSGGSIGLDHTYAVEGEYLASLEVTDGGITVYSTPITIRVGQENGAPVVESFTVDPTVGESPLLATFTATFSDLDDDDLTYEVLYGDGQTSGVLAVPASGQISHSRTYTEEGAYSVRVRVSDPTHTVTSNSLSINVGASQLPPVTEGLVMLLESDIKLSLSQGDTVAAWLDGSGHGNNLDAFGDPTVAFQATPGGQPAIVFDGDGDKLQRLDSDDLNDLPQFGNDRTIFTVIQYIDSQGVTAGFSYGRPATNRTFGLTVNGGGDLTVQGYGLANDHISDVAGVGAGWMTQSVVVSSDQASHYRDGQLIDAYTHTYNTIDFSNDSKIVIGEEIGGLGYSQMAIGAVLVYDRALTASEHAAVQSYLNSKYFLGNTPPSAGDDEGLVATGAAVSIDLLANDSDTDGVLNPATLVVDTPPAHGQVFIDPLTGVATYQHDGGTALTDTFTYHLRDEVDALSNTATVTITISPASQSFDNQTVVRWHGDYYQYLWDSNYGGGAPSSLKENRWLRGGPPTGSIFSEQGLDLDQDNQFDDSTVYYEFSLDEALNPPSTTSKPGGYYYHDDMPSAKFYGGLSTNFYNYETERILQVFVENDGAGGSLDYVGYEPNPYTEPEFQGMQDFVDSVQHPDGRYRKTHVGPHEDIAISLYRPNFNHPIDPSDDSSDNMVTFDAAFLWKKEDFLAGGDSQRVSLNDESYFSFETTRWWENISDARWLIQDGTGQIYISEFNTPGAKDNWGHTNLLADPLGVRWAVYNPTATDMSFDSASATWIDPVAANLFTDIQSFGLFFAQTTPTHGITEFALDEIIFNAAVGEPGTGVAPNPVTDGLVIDLDAGSGVVIDGQGDVTGWLDSSGNGNDLQSALGEGELVGGATPSGEEAIHLDAGEGLVRYGAVDPLNGLPTGDAERTLFFVVQYTSATEFGGLSYGSPENGFGLGIDPATGKQTLLTGVGGVSTNISGAGVGWLVQSVVLDQSGYRLYSNGVLVDQGFHAFDTEDDRLAIGASLSVSGGAELDVAAAMVFDRALSEMERHELGAYLHNRYLSEG